MHDAEGDLDSRMDQIGELILQKNLLNRLNQIVLDSDN